MTETQTNPPQTKNGPKQKTPHNRKNLKPKKASTKKRPTPTPTAPRKKRPKQIRLRKKRPQKKNASQHTPGNLEGPNFHSNSRRLVCRCLTNICTRASKLRSDCPYLGSRAPHIEVHVRLIAGAMHRCTPSCGSPMIYAYIKYFHFCVFSHLSLSCLSFFIFEFFHF